MRKRKPESPLHLRYCWTLAVGMSLMAALVLWVAVVSAASAGEVGPAFLIGIGDSAYYRHSQWDPAIALDGANYLVVWTEGDIGNYDVYGARVSAAGAVLDSGNIAICTAGLLLRSSGFSQIGVYGLLFVTPRVTHSRTQEMLQWSELQKRPRMHFAKVRGVGRRLE